MLQPALYLIPRSIGLNLYDYPSVVRELRYFVCESERGFREFLANIFDRFKLEDYEFLIHNEHTVGNPENKIVFQSWLQNKLSIGMISDVGIPAIADPGADLVMLAHEQEYTVIPLVNESSIMAALCASGLNGQEFIFHGYPPIERDKLRRLLQQLLKHENFRYYTHIFIEAPYRNKQLFQNLLTFLPSDVFLSITVEAGTENSFSRTRRVEEWKKSPLPEINKKRAVFLFGYA